MHAENLFKIKSDPLLIKLKPLYRPRLASIDEFIEDCKIFNRLKRMFMSIDKGNAIHPFRLRNTFIFMFNVFGETSATLEILDQECDEKYRAHISAVFHCSQFKADWAFACEPHDRIVQAFEVGP